MQSEESNTLVKLAKAVIEHAPEGGDAFWGIKFSDIEAALSAAEPVAAMTTDYLGCEYVSMDVAGIEKIAATHSKGPTKVVYLYAAPPAPSVAVKALVEACQTMADDHQTSENHHPNHVLVPHRAFIAMRDALYAQVQDVAGELSRINDMMEEGDDDGSPILPEFGEGWSVEAKVAACLHLLEKRRDVIEGFTAKENWQDDPAQDERWNAGFDFAVIQLCKVLKVDPKSINWDCATETLEGDAQSQIHKVLAAAPAKQEG